MTHVGPVAIHAPALRAANDAINAGLIEDLDDAEWDWNDDDQERSFQAGGNAHLAVRTDVPPGKDQFVYPCMRGGKVHMEALRSVCRESGKNGAENVGQVARDLLAKAKAKRDDMGE